MVAAHIYDCRAAASYGVRPLPPVHRTVTDSFWTQLKTIYVPRTTEDQTIEGFTPESVKCKADGGEVDVVAIGLGDIAKWLK